MKTNAIRIGNCGGPEVLEFSEIDLPELQKGEARIKAHCNRIKFYRHLSSLWSLPHATSDWVRK